MITPRAASWLVTLALAVLIPAAAAEPILNVRAKIGLGGDFARGGYYRVGAWAPACVEIANGGDPFIGAVEVRVEGPDGAPIVSLAPATVVRGTVKRIFIPVRPYAAQERFGVRLVDASRRAVHAQEIRGIPSDPLRFIGVVTALGRPGIPIADPDARRIQVVYLEATDLAGDERVYDALDALVVLDPNVDAGDPVGAGGAVRAWVASGRPAVLTIGSAGPAMASGTFAWAAAAPIPRGVDREDFSNMRAAFAPRAAPLPPRRATTPDLRGQPGRVLATADEGLPLALERTIGLGRLRLVGPDLQASPFLGWTGLPMLWDRLLDLPEKPDPKATSVISAARDPLQAAFETLRFLVPISIGFVLLFISAYILAVGPGDYFLLRWLGRRFALTWFTVPVWSLLFCGLLYAVTAYKRGGDLTVRGATVVDVLPGSEGCRGVTYTAVYTPAGRRFDFRLQAPAGWMAPRGVGEGLGGLSFGGSGGAYPADGSVGFLGFPIAANVMRTMEAAWRLPSGPYRVEIEEPDGKKPLRLVNRGSRPLSRAVAVFPDGTTRSAGDLKPGEAAHLDAHPRDVQLALEEIRQTIQQEAETAMYRHMNDDASMSNQNQRFKDLAEKSLLWYSLGSRYRPPAAAKSRGEVEVEESSRRVVQVVLGHHPDLPAWRRHRLDVWDALPRFRALILGWDDASPVPVLLDGAAHPTQEKTLVRIWVPGKD
jgi:hypothetical protein